MKINLYYDINPKAIQSFKIKKMGDYVTKYQPKSNIKWKEQIKFLTYKQLPENFVILDCELIVTKLIFIFKLPANAPKYLITKIKNGDIVYKNTKPDIDNLQKGFFDALQGIVYKNDSRIVSMRNIKKIYGIDYGIIAEIYTN